MMSALPALSKILSGPGARVTRVVSVSKTPYPPCTSMLTKSPEWKGWLASTEGLPEGPGSKCPPAEAQGSQLAIS